ncbi:NUDIX domain-containing protein [Paenibacillus sp. D51F]
MELLYDLVHPKVANPDGSAFVRRSARGIIVDGTRMLVIYTARYDDYGIPGGGIEPGEDMLSGLRRELEEEAGCSSIEVVRELGRVEEIRPARESEYENMRMSSCFYVCRAETDFSRIRPESHEIANGSRPEWVEIADAISHNRAIMERKGVNIGFAIERETLVMELVERQIRDGLPF